MNGESVLSGSEWETFVEGLLIDQIFGIKPIDTDCIFSCTRGVLTKEVPIEFSAASLYTMKKNKQKPSIRKKIRDRIHQRIGGACFVTQRTIELIKQTIERLDQRLKEANIQLHENYKVQKKRVKRMVKKQVEKIYPLSAYTFSAVNSAVQATTLVVKNTYFKVKNKVVKKQENDIYNKEIF